jgi:hypothetical protein
MIALFLDWKDSDDILGALESDRAGAEMEGGADGSLVDGAVDSFGDGEGDVLQGRGEVTSLLFLLFFSCRL